MITFVEKKRKFSMNDNSLHDKSTNENDPKYKQYLCLITANQRRIYGFVYAMVPNHTIAEDIMQEITLIMWEKFESFKVGTNFSAWGISIARNKILQYSRRQKRQFTIFDTQAMENLVGQSDVFEQENDQIEALRRCFKKLKDADKKLIEQRYVNNRSLKEIAEILNLSASRTCRIISRIHNLLLDCIKIQAAS